MNYTCHFLKKSINYILLQLPKEGRFAMSLIDFCGYCDIFFAVIYLKWHDTLAAGEEG
jgi:hypothetical protein